MARGLPGPRFNRLWIVPISGANPVGLEEAGPPRRSRPRRGFEREDKMFAVIKTGGKQYRVAANETLQVEKLAGAAGDTVTFADVLMLGGDEPKLGAPLVSGAAVLAEIVEQKRGRKVIIFKKRRRQNSRRKNGHRQEFTLVRITEIVADAAQAAKPARKAKAAGADADPASDAASAAIPAEAAAVPESAQEQ
jgi:large subunit ribosomal protein L21